MLAAIALTPSAPVLVPELAGRAAAEVAEFRNKSIPDGEKATITAPAPAAIAARNGSMMRISVAGLASTAA